MVLLVLFWMGTSAETKSELFSLKLHFSLSENDLVPPDELHLSRPPPEVAVTQDIDV